MIKLWVLRPPNDVLSPEVFLLIIFERAFSLYHQYFSGKALQIIRLVRQYTFILKAITSLLPFRMFTKFAASSKIKPFQKQLHETTL